MSLQGSWLFAALLASIALTGCYEAPAPSKEEIALREATPERLFEGKLAGRDVRLIVHDCEVFDIQKDESGRMVWTLVLEPEFYPSFMVCQRQSLTADAKGVTAVLGRMAFGAGGCCASGGTYHSTDGREWKKK